MVGPGRPGGHPACHQPAPGRLLPGGARRPGRPAGLDAGCGGGLVPASWPPPGPRWSGSTVPRQPRRGPPGRRQPFRPARGRLERLPFADGSFDTVVAADVLEHLPDLPAAVNELARVLFPGGSFLFDTVNRTPWAWFTAVFGLEQVLRMVPRGTHDWRLFIRPADSTGCCAGPAWSRRALGLAPQVGPAVARGLLTRRIDIPTFTVGNGRRASYLGHYRKAPWRPLGSRRSAPRCRTTTSSSSRRSWRRSSPASPGGIRPSPRCSRSRGGPAGLGGRPCLVRPAPTTADRMRAFALAARGSGPRRPGGPWKGRAGRRRRGERTCWPCPAPATAARAGRPPGRRPRPRRPGPAPGHRPHGPLRGPAGPAHGGRPGHRLGRRALVTCVELSTLHTQPPKTREDAVYLALFGDGAAAAPWSASTATVRSSPARPR